MGTVLKDKARGLNLAMTGGTWILPEGRSAVLNGTNSYLKINSGGSIVIDSITIIQLSFGSRETIQTVMQHFLPTEKPMVRIGAVLRICSSWDLRTEYLLIGVTLRI